jgi:hypothetical protein
MFVKWKVRLGLKSISSDICRNREAPDIRMSGDNWWKKWGQSDLGHAITVTDSLRDPPDPKSPVSQPKACHSPRE